MTLPTPTLSASTFQTMYLGIPGAMTKAPVPDNNISHPLDRAGQSHKLAGGGNTVSRARFMRRTYSLSYTNRTHDEMDPLLAYYFGTMGPGPFALMIPGWRNLQDTDVSTMGVTAGGLSDWSVTSVAGGTLAYSTAVPPPLPNTGLMSWTTPANSAVVNEGTYGTGTFQYTPNITNRPYGVPYLPDQPFSTSIYARTASSTCSVRAAAVGASATTVSPVYATGPTVVLTTAWQRLQVSIPVGTAGWSAAATAYIASGIQCMQAGAPTIYLAASQIEAGLVTASAWLTGMGCPRVIFADPLNASLVVFPRRTQSFTLLEV